MSEVQSFTDNAAGLPPVRGFLHSPSRANGDVLLLTHGAGANCGSKLMVALAESFSDAGLTVLRYDLPFRQLRPYGPPVRGSADRDQEGIRRAAELMRARIDGRLFLAGHSYGGRQSSILAAADPSLANGLLLLSYPLHPPKSPTQLRTAHFPDLKTPSLFVSGTRDGFGSKEELQEALKLIPARTELMSIEGAGHVLLAKKIEQELPSRIVNAFLQFIS